VKKNQRFSKVFFRILCILVFTVLANPVYGTEKARFGILGGVQINIPAGSTWDYHLGMGIQDEEIYTTDASVGISAAGLGTFALSRNLFFRSGISISKAVYNMEYYLRTGSGPSYTTYTMDFTAVEIPLMIGLGLFRNHLKVFAGPGISFLSFESSWSSDFKPSVISIDAGVSLAFTDNISAEVMVFAVPQNIYVGSGFGYLDLKPELGRTGITIGSAYTF